MEEAFMENRELTELELESVSGGSMTIDFGYVRIHMSFAAGPGNNEDGPAWGAIICGSNGCSTQNFGP